MRHLCEQCGNRFDATRHEDFCPFCGFAQEQPPPPRPEATPHRLVNLERGNPTVEAALNRLENELHLAQAQGLRVLTLVHGYGSTGRGGVIRQEARARLELLRMRGEIERVLFGEDFEGHSGRGRQMIREFPYLENHASLNKRNPGITLVFLPAVRAR